MKIRESGMPEEQLWDSFFDVDFILAEMEITSKIKNIVEIGCGYGTFTLLTSEIITGRLIAFDIEPEMIQLVSQKAQQFKTRNIQLEKRDIISQTTGLEDNSMDYVMLFNILHHEKPAEILNEAYRILNKDGKVGIIHWRSDISTPRGPSLKIRPIPAQCIAWAHAANFSIHKPVFPLNPYHFGLILSK